METIRIKQTILLFLTTLSCYAQYYMHGSDTIKIKQSNKKFFVEFNSKTDTLTKRQILSLNSVTEKGNDFKANQVFYDYSRFDSVLIDNKIASIKKNKNVIKVENAFEYEDGTLQALTNEVLFKIKSGYKISEIEVLSKKYQFDSLKQNKFDELIFSIFLSKKSKYNAIEFSDILLKTGLVDFAEPNWIKQIRTNCANDQLFTNQWGLKNTGQFSGTIDADISACNAWNVTTGRNDIIIAVIDSGVDTLHPDLSNNLVAGYDATGGNTRGNPTGNYAHGTNCAGIIAARRNNSTGISGVAPDCRIMPVRIFGSSGTTQDSWCADGINWARQNGADILSNSWGGGSPSNTITTAINNAVSNGRNGLGCVVLFSSGNNNASSVSYPSSLSNVIAVGAMSMCNERKRSSSNSSEVNSGNNTDPQGVSCDGEKWWGSNYGSEIDVVAPGVKVHSTDIRGSAGYNTSAGTGGDYYDSFNGTSSACPHAAGVAALILSVNRCLSTNQVRQVLELSCDKVGAYCYDFASGHSNGLWNNQMGYGKINANNAVNRALGFSSFQSADLYGGTDNSTSSSYSWVLTNSCTSGSASGLYIVKRHQVSKEIDFSAFNSPNVVGMSNGLSQASPNDGRPYCTVSWSPLPQKKATLTTYVYEGYNTAGQFIGWIPTSPSNVRFSYTVQESVFPDYYAQNRIATGTENIKAVNNISAGSNVIPGPNAPQGQFTVESGANVSFTAGKSIRLKAGFRAKEGSTFRAKIQIEPSFTCTQFPNGRLSLLNNSYFEKYETKYFSDSMLNDNSKILSVYPNPITTSAKIQYQIESDLYVTISLTDICGIELVKLKSSDLHKKGTYEISFEGIRFPAGLYFVELKTNNSTDTKKIIITP